MASEATLAVVGSSEDRQAEVEAGKTEIQYSVTAIMRSEMERVCERRHIAGDALATELTEKFTQAVTSARRGEGKRTDEQTVGAVVDEVVKAAISQLNTLLENVMSGIKSAVTEISYATVQTIGAIRTRVIADIEKQINELGELLELPAGLDVRKFIARVVDDKIIEANPALSGAIGSNNRSRGLETLPEGLHRGKVVKSTKEGVRIDSRDLGTVEISSDNFNGVVRPAVGAEVVFRLLKDGENGKATKVKRGELVQDNEVRRLLEAEEDGEAVELPPGVYPIRLTKVIATKYAQGQALVDPERGREERFHISADNFRGVTPVRGENFFVRRADKQEGQSTQGEFVRTEEFSTLLSAAASKKGRNGQD